VHDKCFTGEKVKCIDCKKKKKIWEGLWDGSYWNSNLSKVHNIARLIPLNKEFPKTPTFEQN